MITVNLQGGGTFGIAEEALSYIKNNTGGSEIVIVEGGQPRSIFSSQSPSVVAGLSPYILSLTNIEDAEVQATINYTGLNGTIDFTFFIGAGRWSKLTDNGSAVTALAQIAQNISANQSITSTSGFATVSSVSYSYPTNVIYLNALRIKDVSALGIYGGSLVKYDDAGAELAEYELGIAPSALIALIAATGGGGSGTGWELLGNAGTTAGTNFIGTTDAVDFVVKTDDTEQVRVLATGEVGIGTNTPAYKLEIAGNLYQEQVNGDDKVWIKSDIATGSVRLQSENTNTTDLTFLNVSTGNTDLAYTNTTSGLDQRIKLKQTGGIDISVTDGVDINTLSATKDGIGIGISTPTEALDVVGNVKLSGALITVPQYAAPLTGDTVTSNGSQQLIINPLGTLLALTVDFPATPVDGQRFDISCTQIITGLTLTAAATILGTLTTFAAANAFAGWVYSATAAAWVRQH